MAIMIWDIATSNNYLANIGMTIDHCLEHVDIYVGLFGYIS